MNDIVNYPDLQQLIQHCKSTGESHFKLAWGLAHNIKYEDVTDKQEEECRYVYYAILSQAMPRPSE